MMQLHHVATGKSAYVHLAPNLYFLRKVTGQRVEDIEGGRKRLSLLFVTPDTKGIGMATFDVDFEDPSWLAGEERELTEDNLVWLFYPPVSSNIVADYAIFLDSKKMFVQYKDPNTEEEYEEEKRLHGDLTIFIVEVYVKKSLSSIRSLFYLYLNSRNLIGSRD